MQSFDLPVLALESADHAAEPSACRPTEPMTEQAAVQDHAECLKHRQSFDLPMLVVTDHCVQMPYSVHSLVGLVTKCPCTAGPCGVPEVHAELQSPNAGAGGRGLPREERGPMLGLRDRCPAGWVLDPFLIFVP